MSCLEKFVTRAEGKVYNPHVIITNLKRQYYMFYASGQKIRKITCEQDSDFWSPA